MNNGLKKRQRRAMRLEGYDYSTPGMYFVTICVHGRHCSLGEITGEHVILSEFGKIAHDFWEQVPQHFPCASIDCFIIMPNHVHAVIQIHEFDNPHKNEDVPSYLSNPQLGQVVAYYKYQTSIQVNQTRNQPGARFWQNRFYDHIIRDENELDAIQHYIMNNHLKWEEDQDNPKNWEFE